MSNYCELLFFEEFDFGINKEKIIQKLNVDCDFDWSESNYIHISFCREYWKDKIKEIQEKIPEFCFDWVFVINDCSDEGGFYDYELNLIKQEDSESSTLCGDADGYEEPQNDCKKQHDKKKGKVWGMMTISLMEIGMFAVTMFCFGGLCGIILALSVCNDF